MAFSTGGRGDRRGEEKRAFVAGVPEARNEGPFPLLDSYRASDRAGGRRKSGFSACTRSHTMRLGGLTL